MHELTQTRQHQPPRTYAIDLELCRSWMKGPKERIREKTDKIRVSVSRTRRSLGSGRVCIVQPVLLLTNCLVQTSAVIKREYWRVHFSDWHVAS
jgi:hypothetical protein